MTPKYRACLYKLTHRYVMGQPGLVTEDGTVFHWRRASSTDLKVGETAWMARRLNVSNEEWCFEIYQIKIPEHFYKGKSHGPRSWFGNGRYLVEKA